VPKDSSESWQPMFFLTAAVMLMRNSRAAYCVPALAGQQPATYSVNCAALKTSGVGGAGGVSSE
jgi:hypothetical protein